MPNFLIITKTIPDYSKHDIDLGNTPKIVIQLCLCLKEAFFLAYKIREYVNFYIYIEENEILIKFEGKTLKYLGPDERSQSLLLEKALKMSYYKKTISPMMFIKSTPGIFIKKVRFKEFIESQENSQNIYVLNSFQEEQLKDIEVLFNTVKIEDNRNSIFICFLNYDPRKFNYYLPYLICLTKINILEGLNKKIENLPCWDKILYINHYFDKINYDN